jgi:hypothetical protein
MVDDVEKLKESERGAVAAEPTERDGSPFFALILIGLGLYFLARNYFGVELLENWWALFILIPAFASFNRAWSQYKAAGQWRGAAGRSLTGAVLLTAVAAFFLLGLDFGLVWPFLLIILGISVLLQRE